MTKYKSKYQEFSFYVDGERKAFRGGFYETTNKAEQKVLDGLKDVKKDADASEAITRKKPDPTEGRKDFEQSGPVVEDKPGGTLKQSGAVTEDKPGGTFEQSGPVTDDAKPAKAKASSKK